MRKRKTKALKIYDKHTQASSISFINNVAKKFPFKIKIIRTDNGHNFQTKLHWNVSELGMVHIYIKPATPSLNANMERSHLMD